MAEDTPETHLEALGARFMTALAHREAGRSDVAVEIFKEILAVEPRLAEPRLELGRVWFDQGRLDDAEAEVREALRILEAGGQWSEEIPENVMLALGWALLGAILQGRAQSDEVVFGPPEAFQELVAMARAAFARAAELDPEDRASAVTAAELGDEGEE